MATQVKHRRGNTNELVSFTPAIGELVMNTDTNELILGDGATTAGHTVSFKEVTNVAQLKTRRYKAGDVVATKGYYTAGDGGDARYIIAANQTVDGYGDHLLNDGQVALLQHGAELPALQYGVNPSQSANADALKACTDAAGTKNCAVILPNGTIKAEKTVQVIPGVSIRGAGRGRSVVEADGDYTVFEFTTNFRASEFSVSQTSGTNEGIAFGNKRTDGSDNQAVYCFFDRVAVVGFDFSWWYRCSIWCSWKDCYSRSLVGIRFARNADPYDVTSNAPGSWNSFSPTLGWFHNVGTIHNMNFEDVECGIYGCCMGYHISGCTTQRQNGDKSTNKILPVTEERTGIWLESGTNGTRSAWNNIIEAHYAESCRRPFYIQDQRITTISSVFIQGGVSSDKYRTPLEANNSSVYIDGFTGQDWFDFRTMLLNNAKVYGVTTGAVNGNVSDVQDTSMLYEKREQELFTHKYSFESANATDSFTLPVTLVNDSHYELYIGGLYDGLSLRHAVYDVFKWNSSALTDVVLRSGVESEFNITVSGSQLIVNKSGSQQLSFRVVLKEISPAATMQIGLTAD